MTSAAELSLRPFLRGPWVPPWFDDNGCGPRTPYGVLAWLVPDELYGHDISLACRAHDWHYALIADFVEWRAGDLAATERLQRYLAWLEEVGRASEPAQLDLDRAEADAFFRANVAKLLQLDGASRFTAWRISRVYWLGVRLGGGLAMSAPG